jgi:hypothetical protein
MEPVAHNQKRTPAMMIAVFNNLPELALGITWTVVAFATGRRFERWKALRRAS